MVHQISQVVKPLIDDPLTRLSMNAKGVYKLAVVIGDEGLRLITQFQELSKPKEVNIQEN